MLLVKCKMVVKSKILGLSFSFITRVAVETSTDCKCIPKWHLNILFQSNIFIREDSWATTIIRSVSNEKELALSHEEDIHIHI